MEAGAAPPSVPPSSTPVTTSAPDLLVRHCLSLDELVRPRRPARLRLEEALGPELARRLLAPLTVGRG